MAAGNVAWPRVGKSRHGEDVDVIDIALASLFPLEGYLEGVGSSQGGV